MDRELISKELDINRVVFIGRTFDEYMKMFNLSLESLKDKKVLDCPAGACSFTAIARQKGIDSTSADIVYFFEHYDYLFRSRDVILYLHAVSKAKPASNIQ